ncbi:TetR-like C-terminal domain-containing protein [Agromyces sp. NPDC056965]|uniref:TetR-like C-terminal domain-containing protein n=1 Tax=Agromyces sp. NPDC056965 TaxID=3345983 RepID=UPI003630F0C1
MKASGSATGRPRIAAIDASLAAAFEELIAEIPVRDFSVRALVSRAGTTRDAFYRRYASLGHFFIEIVLGRFATDPTEDTGALVGDLLVIVRAQREMYDDPLAAGLLPLILDASFRDPVTAESLSTRFIQRQRVAALEVLGRAVARGEIGPMSDPQFVVDQLYSPMFFRAVLPGMPPIDEAYEQAIVTSVLTGLGVAHPDDRLATALERSAGRKTKSSGEA